VGLVAAVLALDVGALDQLLRTGPDAVALLEAVFAVVVSEHAGDGHELQLLVLLDFVHDFL